MSDTFRTFAYEMNKALDELDSLRKENAELKLKLSDGSTVATFDVDKLDEDDFNTFCAKLISSDRIRDIWANIVNSGEVSFDDIFDYFDDDLIDWAVENEIVKNHISNELIEDPDFTQDVLDSWLENVSTLDLVSILDHKIDISSFVVDVFSGVLATNKNTSSLITALKNEPSVLSWLIKNIFVPELMTFVSNITAVKEE